MQNNEEHFYLKTEGFSMWPFLKPDNNIVAKKIPITELRRGDIILYKSDIKIACHRLIKKISSEGKYILYVRGDNSISSPELISEEMYIGKLTAILKNGKIIDYSGVNRIINHVVLIIAPLVASIVRIIRGMGRGKRKNKLIS